MYTMSRLSEKGGGTRKGKKKERERDVWNDHKVKTRHKSDMVNILDKTR